MKKSILVAILAFTAISLSAQRVIPRIGISLYQASMHDKYPEYDRILPRVGFTAGIGYEVNLKRNIFLQPEINFVQKGFVYKHEHYDQGEDAYEQNKFTLTVNYLELPVLLKNQWKKFYIAVGPSVGFGIGGKLRQQYDFNDISVDLGFDKTYKVKFESVPEGYASDSNTFEYVNNRMDVGFQLGAGFEVFKKFIVEVRYSLGVTRLYDSRDTIYQFEHANQTKNQALLITLGVPLSFTK